VIGALLILFHILPAERLFIDPGVRGLVQFPTRMQGRQPLNPVSSVFRQARATQGGSRLRWARRSYWLARLFGHVRVHNHMTLEHFDTTSPRTVSQGRENCPRWAHLNRVDSVAMNPEHSLGS
jgi:hypothetical protein